MESSDWHHPFGAKPVTIGIRAKSECTGTSDAMLPLCGALKWLNAARQDAVETMASWYNKQHQFPLTDQTHFAQTFLDRCTDTTAQTLDWENNRSP